MKKLILLLATAASGCFAQTTNNDKIPAEPIERSKFSIGLQGGYGHSFVEPYKNYNFMSSWNAGITSIYAPCEHFGVGVDVMYSGEGVKLETNDITTTTQLDYLRIPIKAIWFFRNYEKDFRPKVSIGPNFGFMVDDHGNKGYATFDFGANATLGFNYRIMRAVWLNMDVNYYQGFSDITALNTVGDHNGNIRLNIGLCMGF